MTIRNAVVLALLSLPLFLLACAHPGQLTKAPAGTSGAPLEWKYAYDQTGRISGLEDPGGRQTTIRYDHFDGKADNPIQRVVKKAQGGSEVAFTFDPLGRRVGMNDSIGQVAYEYDGLGRLSAVKRQGGASITYGYDSSGRRTMVSVGEGLTVEYAYDFLGRLSQVRTPAGAITYDYFPSRGQVSRKLPNGVFTVWTYRPDGLLESIVHSDAKQQVIAGFAYEYRPDGLIQSVKESGSEGLRTLAYTYDLDHRLTRVIDSAKGESRYEYDQFGNRTSATEPGQGTVASSYDWAGRMVEHAGQKTRHDAAGNLAEYTEGVSKRIFEHDPENRLIAVQNGGERVQYEYDGDGLLVQRKTDTQTTTFTPDPVAGVWQPLAANEINGANTLFVWEGQRVIAEIVPKQATFILEDHLGTAAIQTKDGAQFHRTLVPNRFGNPVKAVARHEAFRPMLSGLFFDDTAGVYVTRSRAYNPSLARFLEQDPLWGAHTGDLPHPYAYCRNDPINFVDRDGLSPHPGSPIDGALRWYENAANQSIEDAKPFAGSYVLGGIGAGLRASLYDLAGGFIPGQHTRTEQQLASRAWDLAGAIVPPLGMGRGAAKVFVDTSQGRLTDAAIGTFLLYGSNLRDFRIPNLTSADHFAVGSMIPGPGVAQQLDWMVPIARGTKFISDFKKGMAIGEVGYAIGSSLGESSLPTKVGGVYLGAAPEALAYLGDIEGVVLDEKNGRIVLVSSEHGKVDLPPLRLDDVVTLFRSVYDVANGGPFVSIDPVPGNTKTMSVRIHPGMQDNYVGWVAFETDRMMKAYGSGKDNVTNEQIVSRIPDYRQNTLFALQNSQGSAADNGFFARFWIHPKKELRKLSTKPGATILEVPLMVETEPVTGAASPAADAFARWFTKHFDEIANERLANAPTEKQREGRHIYFELRRMATVAAIAHVLRDQGVPLPAWMSDYRIDSVPVPRTTPAVTAEEVQRKYVGEGVTEESHQRIWGGECLLAKRSQTGCPAKTSEKRRCGCVEEVPNSPEANALRAAVAKYLTDSSAFAKGEFTDARDGKKHHMVALPGPETVEVGSNELHQADLSVQVPGKNTLGLTRVSNSFFRAGGEIDGTWAFDVPHLETEAHLVAETEEGAATSQEYYLARPFGAERSRLIGVVMEADKRVALATNAFMPAGAKVTQDGMVIDGDDHIYADKAGEALGIETGRQLLVYRWELASGMRRLKKIEEWDGSNLLASIKLEYLNGRLASATGSDGSLVNYGYDGEGRLQRVGGQGGEIRYSYTGVQVGRVEFSSGHDKGVTQYEYDGQGHLKGQQLPDGRSMVYRVVHDVGGTRVMESSGSGQGALSESTDFDSRWRVVARSFPDGGKLKWNYSDRGATGTLTLRDGTTLHLKTDAQGRLLSFEDPNGAHTQLDWTTDGLLSRAESPQGVLEATYDQKRLTSFSLSARGESHGRISVTSGANVRRIDLEDGKGATFSTTIGTDDQGNPKKVAWKDSHGSHWIEAKREGKAEQITTSWGDSQVVQRNSGRVEKITLSRAKQVSEVSFANGHPTHFADFDHSSTTITYDGQHRVAEVLGPTGVPIRYGYDKESRVANVTVGALYQLAAQYDGAGRITSLVQRPLAQ